MPETMRHLQLPAGLCESAEKKFGARFGGLEQFLGHVLQELVRDETLQMDQNERLFIEQRLKDLGYM